MFFCTCNPIFIINKLLLDYCEEKKKLNTPSHFHTKSGTTRDISVFKEIKEISRKNKTGKIMVTDKICKTFWI